MYFLVLPVFTLYHALGVVTIRDYIVKSIRLLLNGDSVQVSGLPSTGCVSLMEQSGNSRYVLHLLYANTVLRGAHAAGFGPVEVVEELNPLYDISVALCRPMSTSQNASVPQTTALLFAESA